MNIEKITGNPEIDAIVDLFLDLADCRRIYYRYDEGLQKTVAVLSNTDTGKGWYESHFVVTDDVRFFVSCLREAHNSILERQAHVAESRQQPDSRTIPTRRLPEQANRPARQSKTLPGK